jgi:hypothetical protein
MLLDTTLFGSVSVMAHIIGSGIDSVMDPGPELKITDPAPDPELG